MAYIQYRGPLETMTGIRDEQVIAKSVKEVLTYIKKAYGSAAYRTAKAMLITVDQESILLRQGFKTPLASNASVVFLPICGGG